MPSTRTDSPNIQIVRSIMENLAKVRQQRGGWFDSEQENTEKETLAFKTSEALRCFLIAKELAPENFPHVLIDEIVLKSDIKQVLESVKKNGFYPSPYSPIPGVSDQYTEFAAFCLEFSDLVYGYALETRQKTLQIAARTLAKKALNFLVDPKHYLLDEEGCRWAGTNVFLRTRKRNVVEYFTDVYFTSIVTIALQKVLERPVLSLSEREKDNLRNLIRSAGRWIVSRSEAGVITGDEKKSIKKLIYSTWGLRALVETFYSQDEEVRRYVLPIAGTYITLVAEKLEHESVSVGQEYLYILSPTVDEPLHYEERSDWGGIFLTLISLRALPDSDELLEKTDYKELIDSVYNGILLLRDPQIKLWYRDYFIISIHSYLTEGFILYEKFARDFGFDINVTSSMLRKALKDTLADEAVLNTLQQVFYQNLIRAARQSRQNKIIEKALEEFNKNID